MGLSKDLISQFVKTTKDEPKKSKETTVYGTIQKNTDGIVCAKLDGSDILTPVKSTVLVEENDRVTVMIKNHTATVTGNLTDPAANEGIIEAEKGRIDELETANLTVQNTLTAQDAVIKNLDTTYASIKYLDSNYLSAGKIDADYAKIDDVEATYAKISSLDAIRGDITSLNSEVANIDTLIFGSATGNVIQTSFSNAVIAQLGDAQIKSAMVESVSASKITAGDIITNNVRVKSEDGSLIISDETLQISDNNRVRVQIGKDASNDYSINIWDQNGNLMFSKGGITDAAIKEAIIRNDMVSENANIHASKLDVDSLFEEINDSSNTIKSTKVYLDDKKQTLDVAFKSLTTEVTDQGETISSQGTAISTIQGQISSKIWQQDINTAKNEMSTQYSTLEQEVDGISSTVASHTTQISKKAESSTVTTINNKVTSLEQNLEGFKTTVSNTYATVSDLDGLEIGGRNYFRSSQTIDLGCTEQASNEQTLISTGSCVGFYVPTVAGDIWSLSRESVNSTNRFDYCFTIDKPASGVKIYEWNTGYRNSTKIEGLVTPEGYNYLFLYLSNQKDDVSSVKLERGNKCTDWTPAPEDIDTRIASTESSISQLSNKITANVTATTNLGTRMTTIEQTAEDLSVKLDDLTIGGRNLYTKSSSFTSSDWVNTASWPIDGVDSAGNARRKCSAWGGLYQPIQVKAGETYTLSATVLGDGTSDVRFYATLYDADPTNGGVVIADSFSVAAKNLGLLSTSETKIFTTFDVLKDGRLRVRFENGVSGSFMWISSMKLERGDKATDWSPAPEDVENDILEATKTATNYLNFSSSGLVIGDLTSSTLGKNVLIDSDSVDIRNGDTTLASFGADYLYLAKNSRNATIDLCNGLAKLYHQSRLSYDTLFVIETPNATEIRGTSDPLCVTSTVASKPAIKFANADGVLGSIGMVASGTESYITRNHPSTAATYSILDTGNYYKLMDSGWFNGGVLGDNFTVYNDNSQVKYRKIGKQVQIMGTVKPRVDIAGSTTQHTIFTLPSGYRPPYALHQVCYGSNNYTWRLTVNTNGTVCFSRYGLDSGYVTADVGHWINFQATFFID